MHEAGSQGNCDNDRRTVEDANIVQESVVIIVSHSMNKENKVKLQFANFLLLIMFIQISFIHLCCSGRVALSILE